MPNDERMLDPERFEAAANSPDHAAALAYEPVVNSRTGVAIAIAALCVVVVFVGAWLPIMIIDEVPLVFVLVWTAMGGAILAIATGGLRRAWRYHTAPIVRRLAVVLDKRAEVWGSDTSTSTSYYTTLVLRNGTRLEAETDGPLSGLLTHGDIGMAYLKQSTLVAYRRIDV